MAKKWRQFLFSTIIFLCGFAFAVLCGAVIDSFDLAASPPQRMVERWDLFENEKGQLNIPLLENGFLVEIQRKPTSNGLQAVVIMQEGVGSIFEYKTIGGFGAPWAKYSGGHLGEGISWVDLDGNGEFDQRYIYRGHKVQILVSDKWIRATTIKEHLASTSKGMFEFNVHSGKWHKASARAN